MARTMTGKVVSDAMHQTRIVAVQTSKTHPLYDKRYTVTKRYAAHDDKNEARKGDTVQIVEIPPMSKTKSWKVSQIVEKAPEKK